MFVNELCVLLSGMEECGTFKTHFELVAKLPHGIGFPAGRTTDINGIISVVQLLAVIRGGVSLN